MQLANVYFTRLQKVVQTNRLFYTAFAILWVLGLCFQLVASPFEISLLINGFHSAFTDFLMKYITYAGDGIFLTVVGLVIIILNRKLWLITLLTLLIPSLLTQLLKHTLFDDVDRPVVVMEHVAGLHFIEGVYMNQFNSFPSGHTTAAFSLYTLLALLSIHKQSGWMWAVIASLVAISRVYLLQHFWADIIAGSILAVCVVTFIYALFVPKLPTNEITPAS